MKPILDVKETRWSVIWLALSLLVVLLLVLILYQQEFLVPIASATGWLLHVDLMAAAILLVGVVGGVLFGYGRLRPADVGLVGAHLPVALLVTASMWLLTQGVLVLAALVHTDPVALQPYWENSGVGPMLGFFVAMLFGMALMEEIAFRGFLFPQLYLKLGGTHRRRLWVAAFSSQVLFALVHVPTRVLLSQVVGVELIQHMIVLTLAGLFGVVMYLRTQNLLIVVGIHALVNAPTAIVASPVSPFVVTVLLSGVLWLFWPRLESMSLGLHRRRRGRVPA